MLKVLLDEKNMTLYALEKKSKVPHATLCDIYQEKCDINKCSILTMKKIAVALNMSLDDLYDDLTYKNISSHFTFDKDFDLFKSNMCHEVKNIDDINFLKKYLSNDQINQFINQKKYTEALYLLSLMDYLCVKNDLPLEKKYHDLRQKKLSKIVVPESIYLLLLSKRIKYYDLSSNVSICFKSHNILEGEIENVY